MGQAINKLLAISSGGLQEAYRGGLEDCLSEESPTAREITNLLKQRNGFYAFEGALHCFSSDYLRWWNSAELWRSLYELPQDLICFAEDVFGEQFCLCKQNIHRLNPETAELDPVAASVEEWAQVLLKDYDVETGYTVAHEWQAAHGPLMPGKRLIPIKPFVLGGEYTKDNVRPLDAVEGMQLRAALARQIRNLPDGTRVRLRVH
jgi:hypothetical protein